MLSFLALIAPTFAHEPMIKGPPPPLPPVIPLGLGLPIAGLGVLALVWWIARRWSHPGTKRWARNAAFGVAIGNALLEIASVLQPDRPQVEIIVQLGEEREASAVGDGRPPLASTASPASPRKSAHERLLRS